MTAAKLLSLLSQAGCVPAVRGCLLEFAEDVPEELEGFVELLQSGLRAMLAGRRWFGIDASGRGVGPLTDGALDFQRPLPASTRCLAVEGEYGAGWDVIDSLAKIERPEAFAGPPQRTK
jgi:hypothetical protein